jgi:hypothetical protein
VEKATDAISGSSHFQAMNGTVDVSLLVRAQGTGLSEQQAQLCDAFVYIAQYGEGTASLNVTVAASIVLHHFAVWAGYEERRRSGAKFDVGPRPLRTAPRGAAYLGSLIGGANRQAASRQTCKTGRAVRALGWTLAHSDTKKTAAGRQ